MSSADRWLLEQWAADRRAAGASRTTVHRAVTRVAHLAEHASAGLLNLCPRDVVNLAVATAQRRGVSVRDLQMTVGWQATIGAARSFYAWAIARGFLSPRNRPALPAARPTRPPRPISRRTAKHYETVLARAVTDAAAIDRRSRLMVQLLALGLSAHEIASLRVDDVDLHAGIVTARRGAIPWRLPLPSATARLLAEYRSEHALVSGPLFPSSRSRHVHASAIRRALDTVAERAFPGRGQGPIRRRLRVRGFRELFLRRLLTLRLRAGHALLLSRICQLVHLRAHIPATRLDVLLAEQRRIVRRSWPMFSRAHTGSTTADPRPDPGR